MIQLFYILGILGEESKGLHIASLTVKSRTTKCTSLPVYLWRLRT